MEGTASSPRMNRLAPVLMLLALFTATASTWLLTMDRWLKLDESYSHGFLLFVISAALTVRTWLRERPVAGFYPLWLLPFVAGIAIYLAGELLMVQALRQIVLVPLILGGMAVLWGWRQLVPFIVPVGVLFFAIPVWDFISWPLQLITTSVNQVLLGAFGVEFEVEGVFIYLIGVGAFEIAHGCSGLRYLLVGMTLSFLYGELNYRRWSSRIMLAVVGVLFSLLANWIRVFVIILAGWLTDMETGLIEDHDTFGWWVFAGTLVPLFFIARLLEKRSSEQEPAYSIEPGREKTRNQSAKTDWTGLGLTVAIPLVAVLFFGGSQAQLETRMQTYDLSPLPSEQWSPMFQKELQGWRPQIKRTDRSLEKTFFLKDGLEAGEAPKQSSFVGLYTYDPQRGGREVVMYGNRLYDREVWVPETTFDVPASGGVTWQGLTLRQRGSDKRLYLAYGYYVESFWETDEVRAKLAQLFGAFNPRSDGSLMIAGLYCEDCDGQQAAGELARTLRPRMQEAVDGFVSESAR